ncbi:hypothetical protein ACTQ45_12680 [Fundicoccus sp. Sow4_D5]|uniref:hypothetical protein n=1 Tax=unclassified Fundicoccus TaxID=2761543 RepID=UPI003F91C056
MKKLIKNLVLVTTLFTIASFIMPIFATESEEIIIESVIEETVNQNEEVVVGTEELIQDIPIESGAFNLSSYEEESVEVSSVEKVETPEQKTISLQVSDWLEIDNPIKVDEDNKAITGKININQIIQHLDDSSELSQEDIIVALDNHISKQPLIVTAYSSDGQYLTETSVDSSYHFNFSDLDLSDMQEVRLKLNGSKIHLSDNLIANIGYKEIYIDIISTKAEETTNLTSQNNVNPDYDVLSAASIIATIDNWYTLDQDVINESTTTISGSINFENILVQVEQQNNNWEYGVTSTTKGIIYDLFPGKIIYISIKDQMNYFDFNSEDIKQFSKLVFKFENLNLENINEVKIWMDDLEFEGQYEGAKLILNDKIENVQNTESLKFLETPSEINFTPLELTFGMGETTLKQESTFNVVIEDSRQDKNWDLLVSYTGDFVDGTMELTHNLYFNKLQLSPTLLSPTPQKIMDSAKIQSDGNQYTLTFGKGNNFYLNIPNPQNITLNGTGSNYSSTLTWTLSDTP